MEQDPLFRFCVKFPEMVDWRFFADMIEQNRRKAIQTYASEQGKNETDVRYPRRALIPITDTYFREIFLKGPGGKGQSFSSMLEWRIQWEWSFWLSDRSRLSTKLNETAFYIEVYRKLNGKYPKRLSNLIPDLIESLPQDTYSKDELIYRTRGEGYVLYSVGRNEVDDGGNSQSDTVFERPATDLIEAIEQELTK